MMDLQRQMESGRLEDEKNNFRGSFELDIWEANGKLTDTVQFKKRNFSWKCTHASTYACWSIMLSQANEALTVWAFAAFLCQRTARGVGKQSAVNVVIGPTRLPGVYRALSLSLSLYCFICALASLCVLRQRFCFVCFFLVGFIYFLYLYIYI